MKMNTSELKAPIARQISHTHSIHGDQRQDPYYWLKDRENQEVIDYLNAENDYRENVMKPLEGLQEDLFQEIVARIQQTDMSVPYFKREYWYYVRYEEGKEYAIYARKKDTLEATEEIVLDENILAAEHAYYSIGGMSVSPDNKLLAYGEDTLSRRIFTIRFKNLETGELLPDVIENTTGSTVWANDLTTVFYTRKDETLRPFQILRHRMGTPTAEDDVIYEEQDSTFNSYISKTKSEQYLFISSHQTVSSEFRFLDAETPFGKWTVIEKRERDHEYTVSHYQDHFYIRTNWNAKNFRLMKTPIATPSRQHWVEVLPHREEVLLEGISIFKDHLVISERKNGLSEVRVRPWNGDAEHYIQWGEEAYTSYVSRNPEFETTKIRVGYTSMTTPSSVFEYDMNTQERVLLKQQPVLGPFKKENYTSARLMVTARDGVQVPVSIVHHRDTPLDGTAPCLLYAYGSYGHSMDPYFSSVRLSLLDRGFVYAIAHIRGGEEFGRHWYEDGKLLNKKNTFYDFIDCGKALVEQQFSAKDGLYAMGGSAGGLLMGAVLNMEPKLWAGLIAAVPFVDVVTTMLDESIPLTTGEYDEWGNPNDEKYYWYIKSYSPYDNLFEGAYPPLLITTGLHDSQVQYWEPAKWIAAMRTLKTNPEAPMLMYCNMETGHGGASGRFARFRETAMEYAFLIDLAGK